MSLTLLVLFALVPYTSASILGPRKEHLHKSAISVDPRSLVLDNGGIMYEQASVLRRQEGFQMPRAFDASIGNNFTQPACKDWLNTFIENIFPCHPVSLMLQTSNGFFDATKSLVDITRVLSTACAVDYNQCSSMMATYAGEILSDDVCNQDYTLSNPIVTQAYAGLLAFEPIFQATCLTETSSGTPTSTASTSASTTTSAELGKREPQNAASHSHADSTNTTTSSTPTSSATPQTQGYCYATAITNNSDPSGSYIYYLPLGFSLPGGTMPTCNSCLQRTMQGFASYATNSSQPLSGTYAQAADSVNVICGPQFVDSTVTVGSAAGRTARVQAWAAVAVAAVVGACAVVL